MVSDSDGSGIVSLKGTKADLVRELQASEKLANEQAFDLYFRLGEIEDELSALMKKRDSVSAVRDFVIDHVNPRIQSIRADVQPTEDQTKMFSKKINVRLETTYKRIIASLLQYIEGSHTGLPPHPSYVTRSQLIEDLVSYLGEYEGISKSGLETKLADASRSFDI